MWPSEEQYTTRDVASSVQFFFLFLTVTLGGDVPTLFLGENSLARLPNVPNPMPEVTQN